jgi:NAD(P)-dependent dehydrogenase (short-subunit alcohol dehydrogenase family)
MTTIAIVGAGPGVGIAVARRFGAAGHSDLHESRAGFRHFHTPLP